MNKTETSKMLDLRIDVAIPTKDFKYQEEIRNLVRSVGFTDDEIEQLNFYVQLSICREEAESFIEEMIVYKRTDPVIVADESTTIKFYGEEKNPLGDPEVDSKRIPFCQHSMLEVSTKSEKPSTLCIHVTILLGKYEIVRKAPKKKSIHKLIRKVEKVANYTDEIFATGDHIASWPYFKPLNDIEVLAYAMEKIQVDARIAAETIRNFQESKKRENLPGLYTPWISRNDIMKTVFGSLSMIELQMQLIRRTLGEDFYKTELTKILKSRFKHTKKYMDNRKMKKIENTALTAPKIRNDLQLESDVIFYVRSFNKINDTMHLVQAAFYEDLRCVCSPLYLPDDNKKQGYPGSFGNYQLIKEIADTNESMAADKKDLKICFIDFIPKLATERKIETIVLPHLLITSLFGFSTPNREEVTDLRDLVKEFERFVVSDTEEEYDDPKYLLEGMYSCMMAAFTARNIFMNNMDISRYMPGCMTIYRPFIGKEQERRSLNYQTGTGFVNAIIDKKPCQFVPGLIVTNVPDYKLALNIAVERDFTGRVSGYALTKEINLLAENIGSILVNKSDFPEFLEGIEELHIDRGSFVTRGSCIRK